MINTGQVPIGTAPTKVTFVPPGSSSLTLTGGTVTVYVGSGTVSTTISNGAPLPAGAIVTVPGWASSAGSNIYAAVAGGTAAIGFYLSTDS